MTLRHDQLTPAEQVTLYVYPFLAITAGLLYIFQPATRLSGPAFDTARVLMSMNLWGCVFLTVGLSQVAAMLLGGRDGSREAYILTLRLGTALSAMWSVFLFCSAAQSPYVSYTSAVWLLGITLLQMASHRQLVRGPRHA